MYLDCLEFEDHFIKYFSSGLSIIFKYIFVVRKCVLILVKIGRINESFKRDLVEYIKKMRREIKVYDDLLFNNETFINRTKNIELIHKEDIPKYHIAGSNARAFRIEYDVRKIKPYEAYEEIDFEIVTCKNGDAYHRILCRRIEIKESLRILEQAIENIPSGLIREVKMKNGKS